MGDIPHTRDTSDDEAAASTAAVKAAQRGRKRESEGDCEEFKAEQLNSTQLGGDSMNEHFSDERWRRVGGIFITHMKRGGGGGGGQVLHLIPPLLFYEDYYV